MTKLFIVLYVANAVAGTFGPLPYDRALCVENARLATEELRDKALLHPEVGVKADEWVFVCESMDPADRPALGAERSIR